MTLVGLEEAFILLKRYSRTTPRRSQDGLGFGLATLRITVFPHAVTLQRLERLSLVPVNVRLGVGLLERSEMLCCVSGGLVAMSHGALILSNPALNGNLSPMSVHRLPSQRSGPRGQAQRLRIFPGALYG
jgi:hypothetical protein